MIARDMLISAVRCCLVIAALPPATAMAQNAAGPDTPLPGPAAPDSAPLPISLGAARDAAMAANIDVIHARQARAAAAAARIMAAARPNPVISYEASQLRLRVGVPPTGTADQVIRIDQPIELGGKRRERMAAAASGFAAAGHDEADTGRTVRQAVTEAYADLLAAQDRLAITRQVAQAWASSADVARKRLAVGDISAGELARQQVEASRALGDAIDAETGLSAARAALAILIGRDGDAGRLVASDAWPAVPRASALPADELATRRPDVQAAQARLEQARHVLAGARALRTPDISVGAQYEHQPLPIGVGGSVGVGIAVPLQIGTRYSGEIGIAGAALGDAEATAQKALAQASAEILAARSQLASASQRRQQLETQLAPAARTAASTAEFAWRRGALSLTDLLDARRALAAAELGLIEARRDEAVAGARLVAAEARGDAE